MKFKFFGSIGTMIAAVLLAVFIAGCDTNNVASSGGGTSNSFSGGMKVSVPAGTRTILLKSSDATGAHPLDPKLGEKFVLLLEQNGMKKGRDFSVNEHDPWSTNIDFRNVPTREFSFAIDVSGVNVAMRNDGSKIIAEYGKRPAVGTLDRGTQ